MFEKHAKIKKVITVVLRAVVILNLITVEGNYVRYCQNFKKIPQSNSRILESYNPRDPPEGSQRTAIEFNPRIPLADWDPMGS